MVTEFLNNPYLWHVIWFTFYQAFLATALALILALPLARSVAYRDFYGKSTVLRILQFTWMLPSIAVALGIVIVYGKQGWWHTVLSLIGIPYSFSLYGLPGILLAHLFFNIPLASYLLLTELVRIPSETWRLASQLGMSASTTFRYIEWPYIKTPFLGIAALVFLLCFTNFTLVLALGGGPSASTIEVAIYHAIKFDYDLSMAGMLAIIQIVFCFFVVLGSFSFFKKPVIFSSFVRLSHDKRKQWATPRKKSFLTLLICALLLIPPFGAILFSGWNSSLLKIIYWPFFWSSVAHSMLIALCAGILSTFLSLVVAFYLRYLRVIRKRFFTSVLVEVFSVIQFIIPPTLLSVGLFLLLLPIVDEKIVGIFSIILINSIMSLPFSLRCITYSAQEITTKYAPLYQSLGLSFWQRWKLIDAPLLKSNIAQALGISAILSLGDFSVIAFFGSATLQTLPSLIYNLLASYQLKEASAVVLCLILLSGLLLVFIDRLIGGKHATH